MMVSQTKFWRMIQLVLMLIIETTISCNNNSFKQDKKVNSSQLNRNSSTQEIIKSICFSKIYPIRHSDFILQMQTFCKGYPQDGIVLKIQNTRLQTWKYRFNHNWALDPKSSQTILDCMVTTQPRDEILFISKLRKISIDSLMISPEIETILCSDNFNYSLVDPSDYMKKIINWCNNYSGYRYCGCMSRIQIFYKSKYKEIWHKENYSTPRCLAERVAEEIYFLLKKEFTLDYKVICDTLPSVNNSAE